MVAQLDPDTLRSTRVIGVAYRTSPSNRLASRLARGVLALFIVGQVVLPGVGQSVGSGGVSQSLVITDETDLHAFRNVLIHAYHYFAVNFANGVPVTTIQFAGTAASGGSRLYSGNISSQPTPAGPLIDRLDFVYRYVGATSLPVVPPDRVKYYLGVTPATFPAPVAVIPTLDTMNFLVAVLGNPPAELLNFLNGRDLVAIRAAGPVAGNPEMTIEFRYEGGSQQLPVTVLVAGSCPGGACTWTVTVQ